MKILGIEGKLIKRYKNCAILYQHENAKSYVVVPNCGLPVICGSLLEAMKEKKELDAYVREASLTQSFAEIKKLIDEDLKRQK